MALRRGSQVFSSFLTASDKCVNRNCMPCLLAKEITSYQLAKSSRPYSHKYKTIAARICFSNVTGAPLFNTRWCGHECITHQECWKCGTAIEPDMEQYFCLCGVVQPPIYNRSYFQIFGIEETFDINTKLLKMKYQKLQTVLHPDRYSQKCETEQNFSKMHSSLVNKAYNILKNPLKRGLYMLGITDEDLEKERETDADILTETFNLSEAIEEASDKDELIKIELENEKNINDLIEKISHFFRSNDRATAKKNLIKLKYLIAAADKIQKKIGNNISEE